jgi:predicted RNase H-related nuclease YkuK (DUF458 family)
MENELVFRKFDGTLIEDVNQYVQNWIKENPYGQLVVGCDSQEHSRDVKYAIVIVMHYKDKYGAGRGAHVIQAITKEPKPKKTYTVKNGKKEFDTSTLQGKLWKEVEYTIQAANMLEGCQKKIMIHLDYNSKETEGSHILYASGLGYAQGMGYKAVGKPDAWGSTHVADALCR